MKKKIAIILAFCMVITCFSGIAIAKDINNSTSNNSTSENTTKSDDSSDKNKSDKDSHNKEEYDYDDSKNHKSDKEYADKDESDSDSDTKNHDDKKDNVDAISFPEFNPLPVKIDDVYVNVSADAGVFPEGATLKVTKVDGASKKQADDAVAKTYDVNKKIAKSYTYDIKIIDKDGVTELEPKDSKKVNVTFTSSEVADYNLNTEVYHINQESIPEDTNKADKKDTNLDKALEDKNAVVDVNRRVKISADKLSILDDKDIENGTVKDSAFIRNAINDKETVAVTTDSFSYYTVNFTYDNKTYRLNGGSSIALDTIKDAVGLVGVIESVCVSNDSLLNVYQDNGRFFIKSLKSFDTNEKLILTINGTNIEIMVTDPDYTNVPVTSWSGLQSAIDDFSEGQMIVLQNDINDDNNDDSISIDKEDYTVVIDLNGKKINRKLNESEGGDGHVIIVKDGSLIINDSSGNNTGEITGGYADDGGGIYIHSGCTVTINGGKICNNHASSDGGGIFVKGALIMTEGDISGNIADGCGGAIYSHDDSHFDIQNVDITGNQSDDQGGAFDVHLDSDSSISNCKIQSNKSLGDYAGAIYMDASGKTLTITNTNIDSNTADDDGGAMYLESGNIVMTNGAFNLNKSDNDSGAIKVTSNTSFSATGTTFDQNRSESEEGGAIKNQGSVTLNGCTITNCYAQKEGGAIYNDSILSLTNCTFTSNSSASKGGAIYSDDTLTIDGITMTGNSARGNGGAIFVGGSSDPVGIRGKIIIRDNDGEDGKNIYLREDRVLTLIEDIDGDSDIWLAMEEEMGIAVTNYSTFRPKTGTDLDNYPAKFFHTDNHLGVKRGGEGESGVELYSGWKHVQEMLDSAEEGSTVTLYADYSATSDDDEALLVRSGKTFTLDLAGHTLDRHLSDDEDDGHVLNVLEGNNLTIKDSGANHTGTITGGYAKEGGGIVVGGGATLTITGGNIVSNKADDDGGGIKNYGILNITGSAESPVVIADNYAEETGGGIYNHDSGTISLSYVDVTRNSSKEEGGGLKLHLANDPTFDHCNIIKNSSETDRAGGVNVASNHHLTITNSVISDNTSSDSGAGIYQEDSGTITIESTQFNTNQSNYGGGAIKSTEGCTVNLTSCAFNNNKATGEYGGGLLALGTATVTSCDFIGNQSSKEGGAIFNGGSGEMTIHNTTIRDNLSWANAGGIYTDTTLNITNDSDTYKITNNTASGVGGGLFVAGSSITTLAGVNTITGNKATSANDIYVDNNNATLSLDNNLNLGASSISIDCSNRGNEVTSGKQLASTVPFQGPQGLDIGLNGDGHLIIIEGRWQDLQNQINTTAEDGTITLDRDYTATGTDTCLQINKNITINLNGHTINRNLGSKTDDGQVFNIQEGKILTINDADNSGTITGGFNKDGGAFTIQEGACLIFNGGTITGNKADVDGGAIYNEGTLTMNGGVITNNYADDTGGAIFCSSDGVFSLSNVTISNNMSKNVGGALNIHSDGDISITDCIITDNASGDFGGAIRMDTSHKLTIHGTSKDKMKIDGNKSEDDGGAIHLQKGEIVMDVGTISGNVSRNDSGAVKVTNNTDFTATNVDFINNTATREEGGAIKTWSHVTLNNCTLDGNNSAKEGGAISLAYEEGFLDDDFGTLTINDCTITNNNSSDQGGGIHADGGRLYINGATITGNISSDIGGGVIVDEETFDFCVQGKIIIRDNKALNKGDNLFIEKEMQLQGALIDGTEIYVNRMNTEGCITEDYSEYNNVEPSNYFKSDLNYEVSKEDDGEAYLIAGWDSLVERVDATSSGETIVIDKDYAGGGDSSPIKIDDGRTITIDLNGHILNRNRTAFLSEEDGHVFIVSDGSTLNIIDSSGNNSGKITGGYATDGGGIYIDDNSTVNFNGGTITKNMATTDGGGIFVNKGTININGGVITDNTAEDGAGIYLDESDNTIANLVGGEIINNTATDGTGGIYVENGAIINVSNSPVVKNNKGTIAGGIYFESEGRINLTSALSDSAALVVDRESGEGQITNGYGTYHGNTSPSKYFSSSKGYAVYLLSGEAVLGYDRQGETDNELPFIEPGSQINTDLNSLGNDNWMSGISGERYLHEINMPVTHDSSMNNVESKWFDYTFAYPIGPAVHKLAKTQIEYIDEQLNDGIRKLDLRLSPVYKKFYGVGYWWNDDGENLYMTHGKTKYGTFHALDPDDDYLEFDTILNWTADFLRNHPTETIIFELSDELDVDYQTAYWENETYSRAGRILTEFSREINPATGESYLYKEPEAESYLEPYTHMPQLKDCRGKVVILSNKNHLDQTGGFTLDSVGVKSWSGQSYKIGPTQKIRETQDHYTELENSFGHSEANPLKLSTAVEGPSNYLWSFALNVTNQESDWEYIKRRIEPGVDCAPYEYAETINEALFGENHLFASSGATDKTGTYLGWVSMDGAKDPYGQNVWRTNFHDGLNDAYVTVTVDPGEELKTQGYLVQEYKLLKGTKIKIPGNIYKHLEGKYLDYWRYYFGENPGPIPYNPGDYMVVDHDVTFKPVFLKDGQVPVSIEWQDSNNYDGLRDKKINFNVTPADPTINPYSITLSEDKGYRYIIKDDMSADIVPNWPKILITPISPYGIDGPTQYRYELNNDSTNGYVFKFIHTSEQKQSIKGDINWIDNDNSGNTRPNSINVSLYVEGNDIPKATTTVVPDTSGKWSYHFDNVPMYSNGEKINYIIKTDELENYATSIDSYNITNVLKSTVGTIDGYILWDDNNSINKRPETVKLHLFANNKEVQSKIVETDSNNIITYSFNNAPDKDTKGNPIEYSVTEDPVDGYNTFVKKSNDGLIIVVNKLIDPSKPQYTVDVYSTNKECKAEIVNPKVSPSNYSNSYNANTEITLTAEAKYGYKYIGWYIVTGVSQGKVTSYGEKVTNDRSYTFNVNSDVSYVAVYEPNIVDAMKPIPKTMLKADKTSKELLNHPLMPLPEGYTMGYALGVSDTKVPSDGRFKESIPKGYDAGRYYVWIKPMGDAYHDDLPAECIIVDIAEGVEPGGEYEDVPVTPGEVNDITGTEDAPEESDPNDAHIDNPENLPITDEDIEMGVNVWVEVKEISESDLSEAERIKIKNASVGYNVAAYFDIKIYVKIGLLEPIQIRETILPLMISFNTNNKLSVDKLDYGIVRLHDGVASFLRLIYDAGKDRIVFGSNQFSPHALVYKDKSIDPVNPIDPGIPFNPNNADDSQKADDTYSYTIKTKAAKTKDDINITFLFKWIIDFIF